MISFNNVSFYYRNNSPIINNLSFSAHRGQRICFFGPSGIGKSTALRLLMGLEKAKKGEITKPHGTTFSVSFQEDRLIPFKTSKENVALFSNEKTAEQILCDLELGDSLDKLPSELSGGMKRRVSLSRALAHDSDVLVLDEALTGLDDATKALCISCIEKYINGRTLFCVTHDLDVAKALDCEIVNIQ